MTNTILYTSISEIPYNDLIIFFLLNSMNELFFKILNNCIFLINSIPQTLN